MYKLITIQIVLAKQFQTTNKLMIKPKKLQLTRDQIQNINFNKIIYAEFTEPGGMGNAGGIMLYLISDAELLCYETSIFNDEDTYIQIGKILHNNLYENDLVTVTPQNHNFHYYYGRMGNHIYVNVNARLIIRDNYFVYQEANNEYQIISSVVGVFNAVSEIMKNQSTN